MTFSVSVDCDTASKPEDDKQEYCYSFITELEIP
jgi:hypothetical protein